MASENIDKFDDTLDGSGTSSGEDGGDGNTKKKRKELSHSEEDDRKAERRAANRRSAFQSRQRRKILIEDLQKTVATLSKDNTELRNNNTQLRAKLETAMLENQLLRKQQGQGAAAVATNTGSIAVGVDSTTEPSGGTTAKEAPSANTTSTGGTTNTASTSSPSLAAATSENATAPVASSSEQGRAAGGLLNTNTLGVGASSPSSSLLGTTAGANPGIGSSHLLSGFNLGGNSNNFGGLGGVGVGGTATMGNSDPLLAARLALATGNMANLSSLVDLNGIGSRHQHNQMGLPSSLAASLAGTASGGLVGGSNGGTLHQQLALLLAGGGGSGRLGPTDQTQQHLALLQAALARPTQLANDSLSQAMRALAQNAGLNVQSQAGSSSTTRSP